VSRCETEIDAPPEDVWSTLSTLADGTTFQDWVAGCKEVRAVEGAWPEPGSSIHHSVGVGALTIDDTTTVEAMEPDRRLVLRAKVRPVGVARVELTLELAASGGTTVVMEEEPIDGPASHVPDAVTEPLLHLRNAETLRRLKALVEKSADPG
jgi:uncharacterized protein YndB with AHSA1/START domain